MTNSALALKQKDRALFERERRIHSFLLNRPPMTDREIVAAMGFVDMNEVRPRINGMIELGYIVKTGDTICTVTGCKVRLVKALSAAQRIADMEPQKDLFQNL